MMWDNDSSWGWGSWLLMSLMMLAVLALIAWGLFLIWRSTNRPPEPEQQPRAPQTPEAMLHERLARGEIDLEEYQERLDALKSSTARSLSRT